MPSGKSRSKEDTWKKDELEKSLKEARDDKSERRKHRDGDDRERRHRRKDEDEEKRERRHRDKEVNGENKEQEKKIRNREETGDDDKRRRHRDKDGDDDEKRRRHRDKENGEDERRRHHRDKDGDDEDKRRRHRDKDDEEKRRRRHRDKENGDDEKRRHHRDKDGEDDDRRRRYRDKDNGDDDDRRQHRDKENGDDEKRRHHRDKDGDDDERRRRHRDKENGGDDDKRRRHRDKDGDEADRRRHHRDKENDDEEERKKRHRDRDEESKRRHGDDNEKRRKHHEGEDDKEERRRRHRKDGEDDAGRNRRRKDEDDDEREQRHHRNKDLEEKKESKRGDESGDRRSKTRDDDRADADDGKHHRHRKEDEDDERMKRHSKHGEDDDDKKDETHKQIKAKDDEVKSEAKDQNHGDDNQNEAANDMDVNYKEVTSNVGVKQKSEDRKRNQKDSEVRNKNSIKPSPKPASKPPSRSQSTTEAYTKSRSATKSSKKETRGETRTEKEKLKHKTNEVETKSKTQANEDVIEEIEALAHDSSNKKQDEDNGDDYDNMYEDDFEDYDDDFEDEEDGDDGGSPRASKGELDDLFQAMNEENDRLLASSRRSGRSDWSDSTELSDDRMKASRPVTGRSGNRTFINFVSAKQRQVSEKVANKSRKRGQELQQLIELDIAQFSVFDMPPVNEYELYMRSFGRSDTKQAYIQTNDDNLDREIQTEEIDMKQKWTQHPPEDFVGCGGDKNEGDEGDDTNANKMDAVRLGNFLKIAGQTILILLEETETDRNQSGVLESQSSASFSQGFAQLGTLPFLQNRHVTYSCFSAVQTNILLTVYSKPTTLSNNIADRRGIICLWNVGEPSRPQKILACDSQPTCCCFSPSKSTLVFAGMTDGSLVVWDLREGSSLHRVHRICDEEWLIRNPTYNTAGVLLLENHHSRVTAIQPITSSAESAKNSLLTDGKYDDVGSGLSFQLASIEENSVMHLWVVAEIANPDLSGSETDLGLAPGGRIKLLKSSSVILQSPTQDPRMKRSLQAYQMQLSPSDPNHFYVGTDLGYVIHGTRHGGKAAPKAYKAEIETLVPVVSLDFTPFPSQCFLAGCEDGTLRLHSLNSELPLVTWPNSTNNNAVVSVQWSRSRPCVFYVLDSLSMFSIWDLSQNDALPVIVENFSSVRVLSFCLSNDHSATGLGLPGRRPQMVLNYENGKTELHTISEQFGMKQQNEEAKLQTYLETTV